MIHADAKSGACISPRMAAFLGYSCVVLAVILPVLVFYYLSVTPVEASIGKLGTQAATIAALAPSQVTGLRIIFIVAGIAPVLCMAFGLMCARRCFEGFARQEYFTVTVATGLRGLARGVFLSGALGLLVAPLLSLMVSLAAARGHRSIALNLDSTSLLMMLFAGLVWQIAAAMTRAAALAEENAQFV